MADALPSMHGSDPAFDPSMDWCLVLVVCALGIALLGIAALAAAAVYRTAVLPAVAFAGAVHAAIVHGDTDQLAAVMTLLVLVGAVSWGAWKLAQRCSWDDPAKGTAASSWFPVAPFSQFRESPPAQPGIVGLTNLGNTCYLNAILQCVAQEPGLVRLLLDDDLESQVNASNPLGCQGEVAAALGGLFRESWSGKRSVVDTRGFRDRAGRFRRQLMLREQQDCHELLHWLLDAVHEDLNRGDNVPGAADAESFSMRSRSPALTTGPLRAARSGRAGAEAAIAKARRAWEQHQRADRSPVMDRWWSMLANRLQCKECDGLSLSFESSLCHPVTVPPAFQSVFATVIKEVRPADALLALAPWWKDLLGEEDAARAALPSVERASPPAGHPACAAAGVSPVHVVHLRLPVRATVGQAVQQLRSRLGLPERSVRLLAWRRRPSGNPTAVQGQALVRDVPDIIVSAHARWPRPRSPAGLAWQAARKEAAAAAAAADSEGASEGASEGEVASSGAAAAGAPCAAAGGDAGATSRFDVASADDEQAGAVLWVQSLRPRIVPRMDVHAAVERCFAAEREATFDDVYRLEEVLDGLPLPVFCPLAATHASFFFVALAWARMCYAARPSEEAASAARPGWPVSLRGVPIAAGPGPDAALALPARLPTPVTLNSKCQEVGPLEPDSSRPVLEVADGELRAKMSGADLRWLVPLWTDDASDDEAMDEAAWTASVRAKAEARIAEAAIEVARAHRDVGLAAQQWKRALDSAEDTSSRARSAASALADDETATAAAKDKALVALDAAHEALAAIRSRPITAPDPRRLPHLHADALVRDPPVCAPGPEIALTPPFELVEPSREDSEGEARQRGFESSAAMQEWEAADGSRPDRRVPLECCLRLLTTPETLPLSLQWRCEGCKAPREATKSQAWWSLPDVLVLPLQRFEHLPTGFMQKNNTPIAYPLALDMAPFLDPDSPDADSPARCEFSLFAVACHAGRLGSGHYTALVRSALNGSWWRADDGSVMELKTLAQHHGRTPAAAARRGSGGQAGERDGEEGELALLELEELVQSPSAYVLFYLRTSELPKASEALRAKLAEMGVQKLTEAPVPAASQEPEAEPGSKVTSRRAAGRRQGAARAAAAVGGAEATA
ncbi:hypothetical protein FNF29_05325 [Cafeteria roenbergensis]|uniref:USP domain-containing protein n=1 Tax=Cafeteria roenbergensis TaxID=33653 RepID=A0A5A8CB15_CAFRO|nr:hypothetical protein FNF29_05325 [Cafeteria roenbergensis]|eukprot:KAA0150313.1 hypothetical protein FNF29_05325 [Cafeteria roenbergensis]